jgi:hypothetical protein
MIDPTNGDLGLMLLTPLLPPFRNQGLVGCRRPDMHFWLLSYRGVAAKWRQPDTNFGALGRCKSAHCHICQPRHARELQEVALRMPTPPSVAAADSPTKP